MADLKVSVAGVEFHNPLIAASGTFGFGREYAEFYPLSALGGISSKGITLKARPGNPAPRIAEAPGGMLNAVGLQNPGVDHFIEKDLPWLREQGVTIIANIAGNTPEDYCAMAEKLNDTDIDMIEMNISCPNVKQGGVQFGTSCAGVEDITKAVRAADGEAFPKCDGYFRDRARGGKRRCGCRLHDQHADRHAYRHQHEASDHS